MSVFHRLRTGYHYMNSWPLQRQLATRFPEYRVVKATKLAIMWMPVIAMLSAALHWAMYNQWSPLQVAQWVFILSLPLQGLYWLGWRAVQPLPIPLLHWCKELRHRLIEAGCDEAPLATHSQYQHMACLLDRAFKRLDSAFWCDQ
ncbi:MAG: terminus macrodomain insulation protein YfbV [Ferrimonas sp.]